MNQAVAPQAELSLDVVLARKFELDAIIAQIQGRHKAELEPHQEELHMCELFVKDEMNKANLQQVKNAAGDMVYFSTKDRAGVEDWDATLATIQREGLWHLLKKDVSKTAVKEYIEAHKAPPPGVKYETYRDLNWRRGKGTA